MIFSRTLQVVWNPSLERNLCILLKLLQQKKTNKREQVRDAKAQRRPENQQDSSSLELKSVHVTNSQKRALLVNQSALEISPAHCKAKTWLLGVLHAQFIESACCIFKARDLFMKLHPKHPVNFLMQRKIGRNQDDILHREMLSLYWTAA